MSNLSENHSHWEVCFLSDRFSYYYLINCLDYLTDLEKRYKAAQEIAEHLQTTIATHPKLNEFINEMLTVFTRVLRDTEPHFISEHPLHQLRKQILEIILRLPTNDVIKEHYVSNLLTQMFRLFEIENEENALVCMKIIMDLHRYYRPSFNAGIHQFLVAVKQLYSSLQSYLPKIFEHQSPLVVKDLRKLASIDLVCQRINVEQLLQNTFTQMTITAPDDKAQQALNYTLLPRSTMSLKVLAEVPLMVVLWYQLYGKLFHVEIADFTMTTINCLLLQPPVSATVNKPGEVAYVKESFKEIYIDFITVQIKVASFIAFVAAKVYKDLVVIIEGQGDALATGLLQLLASCPSEAFHLRRELLIAVRHILNSELMTKFIPHVEKLFDERLLLSNGYSVQDSLQPLAYTTLADLVHRVRQNLSFDVLVVAVNFYARHVHSDTFQWGIHQICCRLMMNLVDCIRKRTEEDSQKNGGRDLLLGILEMYTRKFRTLSKYHIPALMAKCQSSSNDKAASSITKHQAVIAEEPMDSNAFIDCIVESAPPPSVSEQPTFQHLICPSKRGQTGFGQSSSSNSCPLSECRHLVKTLIGATKTVTWGLQQCLLPGNRDATMVQEKLCQPREVQVYVSLVKHATAVLDIYLISSSGKPGNMVYSKLTPQAISLTLKNKEEKEVLEHFAGIFNIMNPETFRQIFVQCIDDLIEHFINNQLLQVIINSFLANQVQSSTFATILLTYLLDRLPVLGSPDPIRPPIYLKLFRSIFGSISLYPVINEAVLEPHLVSLVGRCVELSKSAAHPSNYLMLLRCLFRAIGGGTTERLYKEFYQLLPSLLKTLSKLNYDCHRSEIHDLFVELCLTVPVRLSTLLPFLHLLMGPLVSALAGSPSLVQQGLRTLELCVDNVQPDYFFNYIQPVHRDLMSALCSCLSGPPDVAQTALRIFGKLGGTGRDRVVQNHFLTYMKETSTIKVKLAFANRGQIDLKLDRAVVTAAKVIHQTSVMEHNAISNGMSGGETIGSGHSLIKDTTKTQFLAKQAYEFIQMIVLSMLESNGGALNIKEIKQSLSVSKKSQLTLQDIKKQSLPEENGRKTLCLLLEGLLNATKVSETRKPATNLASVTIDRLCLVMLAQESGVFTKIATPLNSTADYFDGWILFDTIYLILSNERKDFKEHCQFIALDALQRSLATIALIVDDNERFWILTSVHYITEKILDLCYTRCWFSKSGGCRALLQVFELVEKHRPISDVFLNNFAGRFVDALLYVMNDVDQEVSFCCQELATTAINKWIEMLHSNLKLLKDVIIPQSLIPSMFSCFEAVRNLANKLIESLILHVGFADVQVLLRHYHSVFDKEMKKEHLDSNLKRLPYATQVGLLEGTLYVVHRSEDKSTFFSNSQKEALVSSLLRLFDEPERDILAKPCYKGTTSLTALKSVALQLLTSLHVGDQKDSTQVFMAICKTLVDISTPIPSSNQIVGEADLPQKAFDCGMTLMEHNNSEHVLEAVFEPLIKSFLTHYLNDAQQLTIESLKRLLFLIRLFPHLIPEQNLDESLAKHLETWLEKAASTHKNVASTAGYLHSGDLRLAMAILETFQYFPIENLNVQFLTKITEFVITKETTLLMTKSSPLTEPLLKSLCRCPDETLSILLPEDPDRPGFVHSAEMLVNMLKNEKFGSKLRQEILSNEKHCSKLYSMLDMNNSKALTYVALKCFKALQRFNGEELARDQRLMQILLSIWKDPSFVGHVKNIFDKENNNFPYWRIPCYIAKLMIHRTKYVAKSFIELEALDEKDLEAKANLEESIELIFNLLSCFDNHLIYQFHEIRVFVDDIVVKTYPIVWLRNAFFKFASIFGKNDYSHEFKARIVTHLLIPGFVQAFENGKSEQLIGGKPQPELDSSDNVISVFLNNVGI